ncbi:MFS transporter [Pseudomonas sp. RIT-To-2]|uniref:MFS transporter n=1 Tax=Pseudomonas sp. RIT-To-2 TaxID=3462541 RepID=UPI0024131DD1
MTTTLRKQQMVALAIIISSYMMIILDTSIVITGLPHIKADIGLTPLELSWTQSIYTLFFGGFLLFGARSGDIIGGRKALFLGLYIFMVTSLAIALAESPLWRLIARAAQGIGAAFVAPSALMLVSTNFAEGQERNKALSWYGSTAGIGASLGLVVGGVLADTISWRAGFVLNLPVGGLILLFAKKYLEETPRTPNRLDVPGAILSTLGVGTIIYGVMEMASVGWGAAQALVPIAAGFAIVALFFIHEGRVDNPLLPLRILMHRRRAGAYIIRFLFLGAMVGFFFFGSQLLQGVRGFSAVQAAFGFFPMTLFAFVVALKVPGLIGRFGPNAIILSGLAASSLGLLWLSQVTPESNYWLSVALPMVLIGSGQGLAFPPMTAAGLVETSPDERGAASGAVNVAHQLGASSGLGVLSSIAVVAEQSVNGQHDTLIVGCRAVFLMGGGTLIAAFLVTLAMLCTWGIQSHVRTV